MDPYGCGHMNLDRVLIHETTRRVFECVSLNAVVDQNMLSSLQTRSHGMDLWRLFIGGFLGMTRTVGYHSSVFHYGT